MFINTFHISGALTNSDSIPPQNEPPSPYMIATLDEQSFSNSEIAFLKSLTVFIFKRFFSSGLFNDIKVVCWCLNVLILELIV
jgi:hypothetical protein